MGRSPLNYVEVNLGTTQEAQGERSRDVDVLMQLPSYVFQGVNPKHQLAWTNIIELVRTYSVVDVILSSMVIELIRTNTYD